MSRSESISCPVRAAESGVGSPVCEKDVSDGGPKRLCLSRSSGYRSSNHLLAKFVHGVRYRRSMTEGATLCSAYEF